ncbi:MAG: cation:proton antiporter [Erysipelotrichaceae bacterium]
MLLSLALILITSLFLGGVMNRLKLPALLGMLLSGILLGPYVFNQISPKLLDISSEIRQIALIIILFRAGLSLDLSDLKKVGRPAFFLCFVPATFEILAVTILGPLLLGLSTLDAAVLGSILAAVSPAVVVPRMLHLMEAGYGRDHRIPQMIMAGASVDDIYVIVVFTGLIALSTGGTFSWLTLANVPLAVILGATIGYLLGYVLVLFFKWVHMRDTVKVILLLSASFFLVSLESALAGKFAFSGYIAVMALGIAILKNYEILAKRLSGKFSKVWVAAELFLFVMVGAAVQISSLRTVGFFAVALILLALLVRSLGVLLSLSKTSVTSKEKRFCVYAYLPKATVQAAIGSIPLSLGLASGNTLLSVAVLSILISAPLGAILIDTTYARLLQKK